MNLPEADKKQSMRIPGLDGLRGMAALIVLVSHLSNAKFFLVPHADFAGIGKSGVYLFFVLSSFLLSSQLLNWSPQNFRSWPRWKHYFLGRIFRIWPLFLFVILTCFVTTTVLRGRGLPVNMDAAAFVQTLLLQRGDQILWTIPVEFKFYFVLPVVIATLVFVFRQKFAPGALFLLLAAAASFHFLPAAKEGTSPLPFMGIFLTGTLCAVIHRYIESRYREEQQTPEMRRRSFRPVCEALAWLSVAVYVALIPSVYRKISGVAVSNDHFQMSHALFSAIWGVLILGMLHGTGLMRRLLDSPALLFVGMVSYSLYLWHWAVLKVVTFAVPAPPMLKAWLVLIGSLLVAALSYWLIERPALRWSAKLRKRTPVTEPPSAAGAEAMQPAQTVA
jgi:peptidoglycan/LPS O-acetylase OafA/YrhL